MKKQRHRRELDDKTVWIWLQHPFELHERYVRFRRTFTLDQTPATAPLLITADSRYRLYVNGKYVAFGPTRGYPHCQCLDQHDIGPWLKTGRNVLAVCVYQPGYSHFSYVHRANAGLLLSLKVGRRVVVRSDESWRVSPDDSFASDVPRISIYGAGQEHRDLREADNWTTLGYNDRHWSAPGIAGVMGHCPWDDWQISPLPSLVDTLVNARFQAAMTGSLSSRSADKGLANDPHQIVRCAYMSRRLLQRIDLKALPPVRQGKALMVCYDVGHSQVGSARLDVRQAHGGEQILVSYLEKGKFGDWVLSNPETYCHVRMTDKYILAPGRNVLEPFTPRGGRYLLITLVGPIKHGLALTTRFRNRRYPLEFSKEPSGRRDVLSRKITAMCRRSLQSCAQDGFIDSSWREQTLATGDGAVTGRLAAELCGDARLLRHMIELAKQGATPDGVMPGMVPTETHRYTIPEFSFAWVEALACYTHFTGDAAFVDDCWCALEKLLDRFDRDRGQDGLLRCQTGRRFFLDWAELPRDEPSALYNLKYLYALQHAGKLARQTKRSSAARRWKQQENRHIAALRKAFCRQRKWYDTRRGPARSQHLATFLVLTGIVNGSAAKRLMDEAVACSLEKPGNPLILASPYMHYYLFEALNTLNRQEDIEKIIQLRWGRWLQSGAETTWENWEVDFPDGSECHAWSAHPLLYL